jgi:hypothetical protein
MSSQSTFSKNTLTNSIVMLTAPINSEVSEIQKDSLLDLGETAKTLQRFN